MVKETRNTSQYKKTIHIPLGKNSYKIQWDGYQYKVFVNDSNGSIKKYPTTLTAALRIVFKEEMLDEQNPEAVSLQEYARQIDEAVLNLNSENFDVLEMEMKNRQPIKEGTTAKITKEQSHPNLPVEHDDEDDI